MLSIAVVNASKTLAGAHAEMSRAAQACSLQLQRHAAPAWEASRSASVMYYRDPEQVLEGSHVIELLDTPDQEDALGYHLEEASGMVTGRVFAEPILGNGGTLTTGKLSISSVLSHEVLELWGDPQCNRWADGPDGRSYALELCDAVESDTYEISIKGHPVSVSDFLFPSWFDVSPPPGSRFDYLSRLHAPFSMSPGGYVVSRSSGKENVSYGAAYPTWRKPFKEKPLARTARRLLPKG